MASAQYKKLFILRFVAYLSILTGILVLAFELGPVASAEFNYRMDRAFGVSHTLPPQVITSSGQNTAESDQAQSGFGSVSKNESIITPVSTDYGIVIEKINANAKVIPDVDPGNEREYQTALAQGVAATIGSTIPGESGNLYIFSHSVDAPWNVIRFNAVFYLLRELEVGDRIILFYQGKRFDYIVFDKTIASPSDVSFLSNRYDKPVLTLQTCDPPGTLLNRLIVRAKLQSS
ncbi:MAG: sortase family protein [uncultured bacterium]|uniref:Lpxtg-site transpeptidase (Sortase) family protein n=3 Tax=Candidatus Daviesiibacteriota TaxID=1752718 RepID=A0A0G0HCH6_9BACT|nr:MAG: sortase family protein [uncultured bacterium]KKQ09809.1 MAG: Lpxtg-site transpeptidase (Sortase) family protein [Candidatus Daviesbacteria bacterium GW2011_GWB1_36_5]KKQ14065.1 MAG: Lpxtg-site transpeptidase (Sortase) family protein [Candidatus Daviesbacteria bacterium GW2011_GWA1_36_8]OGE32285.1 MAG: hypothetical protein A3C99_03415 [Candidatus Daviesbacteria bacterium RIFCSPHIGHO2_02_FULL_37_9]OGE35582.1 MAG: hypothetical protein A3E66_02405 [Candidatus Daviesbacteria bacterium RIFCSP